MSANTALLGLLVLALASCARGQFFAEQVAALPACQGADVNTFATKTSQPTCSSWLQAAMMSPCPTDCAEALEAVGEECFATFIVFQYDFLGLPVSLDVASTYANATFTACASGQPNTVEAEIAIGQATLSSIPSCASADLEAIVASNCTSTVLLADLQSGAGCSPACAQMVKGYGVDCLLDSVLVSLDKLRPGSGDQARSPINNLLSQCSGTARRLLRETFTPGQLELGRAALATLASASPTLGLF